jgi:hypothetical protein
MANVKNDDCICLDGKQHPVLMRFAAVEELAHLKGKSDAFRSKRPAMRKFAERVYGVFQPLQLAQARFACLPSHQPFEDEV